VVVLEFHAFWVGSVAIFGKPHPIIATKCFGVDSTGDDILKTDASLETINTGFAVFSRFGGDDVLKLKEDATCGGGGGAADDIDGGGNFAIRHQEEARAKTGLKASFDGDVLGLQLLAKNVSSEFDDFKIGGADFAIHKELVCFAELFEGSKGGGELNCVAQVTIFGILGRQVFEGDGIFTVGNNWNVLFEELGKNGLEMGDASEEIFICIQKVNGIGTIPTKTHIGKGKGVRWRTVRDEAIRSIRESWVNEIDDSTFDADFDVLGKQRCFGFELTADGTGFERHSRVV
jgi:hypothetical protein